MAIKTGAELAAACKDVAKNHKTLYVMGCFGAPLNSSTKPRYTQNHSYNQNVTRTAKIKAATDGTFGFDCVCLIKGLLWGWCGDKSRTYGGATYTSNDVPDISANQMIRVCNDVSTDFSNIQVGEVVWMDEHIGVYIGDGLAVESTPKWADGVQITAVHNIGTKAGYNGRAWTKHGKLPYLTYEATQAAKPATKPEAASTAENKKDGLELPTLKNGSKGPSVKALQILLIGNGYSCGSYGADGDFGSATDKVVRSFQKTNELDVDGIVGPATWKKLLGV